MQTSETSRTQAAGKADRPRPHQRADEPARVPASAGETSGVISDEVLNATIERMEYEKPRLVIWTTYDEQKLLAFKELARRRKQERN